MRTIEVSVDVFSKIWSVRQAGEETEDQILSRVLGQNRDYKRGANSADAADSAASDLSDDRPGFYDTRNDVRFAEGFEIFRRYKGKEYRARVSEGVWKLADSDEGYLSLNALSVAIGAYENAWFGWRYRDDQGTEKFIHELRRWSKDMSRE